MTRLPSEKRRQTATGLGLSAVALLLAFAGELMTPWNWLTPTQSPTFFPAAALIGVAVCGLFIAFGFARDDESGQAIQMNWQAISMGGIIGAYAIALPIAGLIVSTLVLSILLPVSLGYYKWGKILILAATTISASWLIFIRLMSLPMKL